MTFLNIRLIFICYELLFMFFELIIQVTSPYTIIKLNMHLFFNLLFRLLKLINFCRY